MKKLLVLLFVPITVILLIVSVTLQKTDKNIFDFLNIFSDFPMHVSDQYRSIMELFEKAQDFYYVNIPDISSGFIRDILRLVNNLIAFVQAIPHMIFLPVKLIVVLVVDFYTVLQRFYTFVFM